MHGAFKWQLGVKKCIIFKTSEKQHFESYTTLFENLRNIVCEFGYRGVCYKYLIFIGFIKYTTKTEKIFQYIDF